MYQQFKKSVIAKAMGTEVLNGLTEEQVNYLFNVVMIDNEGFDGEEISPELMLSIMVKRFKHFGLAPSDN